MTGWHYSDDHGAYLPNLELPGEKEDILQNRTDPLWITSSEDSKYLCLMSNLEQQKLPMIVEVKYQEAVGAFDGGGAAKWLEPVDFYVHRLDFRLATLYWALRELARRGILGKAEHNGVLWYGAHEAINALETEDD